METMEDMSFGSLKQKALVSQLYKDLKFVRDFDDLKIHQVDELGLVYLTGHSSDECEVFFPLAADEAVSVKIIATFQNYLLQQHDSKSRQLNLALMDADSTIVYFCVTPGLLPPSDLELKK